MNINETIMIKRKHKGPTKLPISQLHVPNRCYGVALLSN